MLSRRNFLKLGGAGAVLAMSGASVPLFVAKAFASTQAGAAARGGPRALVIIELSGGNDGLNTVVPYEDPRYYRLRPNLALPAGKVLKLKDGAGLHPEMTALHRLYQAGRVAVIQGVGYPNPNFSHFESADIWHSAQPARRPDRTGWLGRYLDHEQGAKAVNLAGDNPLALYSQTTLVPALNGLSEFYFDVPDYYNEDGPARLQVARQLYRQVEQNDTLAGYIRASALDALATADIIRRSVGEFEHSRHYPESSLAAQLETAARLLKAGLDFRVFYVKHDGFDTHSGQSDAQAGLLHDLSESLAAFFNDLRQAGLSQNVLALTFSEFGRRPEENGGGTDHGSAQPLFIVGDSVRGGLYGRQPSLTDLEDENLKYTLDFRQVYANLLEGWLKVDARQILEQEWPALPIF